MKKQLTHKNTEPCQNKRVRGERYGRRKGLGGNFKEMVCSVKSEKLWRVIKPRHRSARPANQKNPTRNSTVLFFFCQNHTQAHMHRENRGSAVAMENSSNLGCEKAKEYICRGREKLGRLPDGAGRFSASVIAVRACLLQVSCSHMVECQHTHTHNVPAMNKCGLHHHNFHCLFSFTANFSFRFFPFPPISAPSFAHFVPLFFLFPFYNLLCLSYQV